MPETASQRLTRIEFSGLQDYSSEEWTRARPGGPWRPTKWRVTSGSLDSGLKAYGELVFERAIMWRDTQLCGIAFSSWAVGDAGDRIMTQAYRLLHTWFECAHHRPIRYLNVRDHAFLGHFYREFPRGVMAGACWAVQIEGLKACRTCPGDEYLELCLGRRIRQSGMTGIGLEIPVLSGIGQAN